MMPVLDLFRLDGKRALITGGSKGLGLAMAQALAEVGADLVIVSRDMDNLQKAKQELAATGRKIDLVSADLFSPKAVEEMCNEVLAKYGPIHILINNVGGRRENIPFLEQSIEDWQKLMDLNLTSAFVCTKMFGKPMLERKWGRVINIGSMCGQISTKNIEGRHYETAKAALAGFTRAIAADWALSNVTVNTIAPGPFMTDANRRWFREKPDLQAKIEVNIPMARMGNPEEIGGLAVFLASEASSYVTGAYILIDGGYTLW
jgi:NAD(P)-dependent dehydrogenase (short-subunit alcohol dehydrogenase family)